MRRKKHNTTAEYKMELKSLYEQKADLLKKRIEIENTILQKEGSVIYPGYTYYERLTGQLEKTLSAQKKFSVLGRIDKLKNESKRPYNKYYVSQLADIKQTIKHIDGKIYYVKRKLGLNAKMDACHENEPISVKEFIGKENYSDMTEDERQAFKRAKKRREEELRKMKLGLPPYDKIKIKNL